ncbi:myeloperoxidase-like [Porites lutea]|uniref:myeloperoxidase-like n=1 Tax=Porites lutea TaxID=51062 RepID=UPI003CC54E61
MAFSNLPDLKGSVEDIKTAEPEIGTLGEIAALDEISDDNLSEEDDDDFGETDNEKLAEDPLAARYISPPRKRQILSEARRRVLPTLLARICTNVRRRMCRRKLVRVAINVYPVTTINIRCDPNAPFRTIDGAANTTFNRLLPADYGNCISTLRRARNGRKLPNARDVSRFAHGSNADRTNPNSTILTHLTMIFAQFMDHDFTLGQGQGINCEPPTKNPECVNIRIPRDDAIFRNREVNFIELERDAPSKSASFCKLAPREHTNTLTAYIDASNVYGSTEEVADSIRAPDGLLRVMEHPDGVRFMDLLSARTETPESFCPSIDPNRPCFLAGESRNNENQGLSSVHTIFVRHHNRIATFFRKRTRWGPERIYQETRRIVAAQLQVITYNEFLPLVLSERTITKFGLRLLTGTRFFNGYNRRVNAQMTAGFSVAAYRFGHTLIQEWFRRFNQRSFQHREKSEFRPIPVLDFENPQYLYETCQGGVDAILRGLIKDPAGKADGRFSSSVQENLRRGESDLSDLISINIQRGRERGIPGYTKYRNLRLCGLRKVRSFDDLVRIAGFALRDVANLRRIYRNVHDIDFFVGGA